MKEREEIRLMLGSALRKREGFLILLFTFFLKERKDQNIFTIIRGIPMKQED